MFNAAMARAINAREIVERLRNPKLVSLAGQVTHVDVVSLIDDASAAADCIENLSAEIAVLKKERDYEC